MWRLYSCFWALLPHVIALMAADPVPLTGHSTLYIGSAVSVL